MEYSIIKDFAYKVKGKLCEDVNGKITYIIYGAQDSIAINIEFKDFQFTTLITEIQDKIYQEVSVDSICEEIKKEYREKILNAFFKSEQRKRLDSARRDMGLEI